jgi:DNA-binding transcriptional regulator GbsR (MarR family)
VKASEEQFIDDMAQLMVSWGLPRTTGRVYGLLLLQSTPTDLDDIVDLIDVAKSGASTAARQLVALGLARVSGERGTRRLRYQALYTLEAIFAARVAQMHDLLTQLRLGARVAPVAQARRQLTDMANGLELWIKTASQMMNTAMKPGRSKR